VHRACCLCTAKQLKKYMPQQYCMLDGRPPSCNLQHGNSTTYGAIVATATHLRLQSASNATKELIFLIRCASIRVGYNHRSLTCVCCSRPSQANSALTEERNITAGYTLLVNYILRT
jgi:hypothetical protein